MSATSVIVPDVPAAAGLSSVPDLGQQVLRTDISGMPLEWMDFRQAVRLHSLRQIAYSCGSPLFRIHGGWSARSGRRSVVEVHSIIATQGRSPDLADTHAGYVPPLNNQTLFQRDGHLCLYCAESFAPSALTRDHIRPLSRGGEDSWTNVATACRRCNNYKGGRTPEEAGMQLIAVPFVPSYAEYIYLKGRRILADQMEFLLAYISRSSPLHARLVTMLEQSASMHES